MKQLMLLKNTLYEVKDQLIDLSNKIETMWLELVEHKARHNEEPNFLSEFPIMTVEDLEVLEDLF